MLRKAGLLTVTAVLVWCSTALAAFPGRDGLLAVQPLTGHGIELVRPDGTGAHRICTDVLLCGRPAHPRFSPNGQAITFADGDSGRIGVVATDGTCLWCLLGPPLTAIRGSDPAFDGDRSVTFVGRGTRRVERTSLTPGGRPRAIASGRDAAVSATGRRAVVRGGAIFTPGRHGLVRLVAGSSPSWSPGGTALAFTRGGWVWTVSLKHRDTHRLARGAAPAWSPSGDRIAYIAPNGAVTTIATDGGDRQRVGTVRGAEVDWQPVSRETSASCPARGGVEVGLGPEGAVRRTLGVDDTFPQDPLTYPAWQGCLRLTHSDTTLYRADASGCQTHMTGVALSGRFAAMDLDCASSGAYCQHTFGLFDLATGATLDDFSALEQRYPCVDTLADLRVDSSGFAAVRLDRARPSPDALPTGISCPSAKLCAMTDGAGDVAVSSDPGGGDAQWSVVPLSADRLTGITCPTSSFCLVTDDDGIWTTTDPLGGSRAWRFTVVDPHPGLFGGLLLPTCVSPSQCALVNLPGEVLTSTNPRGGPSAWSTTEVLHLEGDHDGLNSLSCPSSSLCVAADSFGNEVDWSTAPWSEHHGPWSAWTAAITPTGLTCPTDGFCIGLMGGGVVTTTDPTGGAAAWTFSSVPGAGGPLTCASASLCVMADETTSSGVQTSTDPAGGASAWHGARVPDGLAQAACASAGFCAFTGLGSPTTPGSGDVLTSVLTSATPADPSSYTATPADRLPCELAGTQPCVLEALYVHDDSGTRVVDSATGTGNEIAHVSLSGNSTRLTWTHDGQPRSLQLR